MTSYSEALRSGGSIAARGSAAPGPRTPVQGLPLHHGIYQKNAIFINLRAVVADYTQKDRDAFLKDDLGLKEEDVRDIFLDPSTLLLHLTLSSSDLCASVLDRLFTGVPWTAFQNNPPVFGWAAAAPIVTVRVTGVPRDFPAPALRQHFECFGPISQFYRLPDRSWSSAACGVFLICLRPGPGAVIPHFVNVVDPQGLLCERFAVYIDGRRRHCFRCGGPGHLGAFCKASCLSSEAAPSLWSSLVYDGPVMPTAVAAAASGDDPVASPPSGSSVNLGGDVVAGTAVSANQAAAAIAAEPAIGAAASSLSASPVASGSGVVAGTAAAAAQAAAATSRQAAAPAIGAAASPPSTSSGDTGGSVAARTTAATHQATPLTTVLSARTPPGSCGSASSASEMSGAEEEDPAATGFTLPHRRRSAQLGSPGSMSPNKKTHKKEPG